MLSVWFQKCVSELQETKLWNESNRVPGLLWCESTVNVIVTWPVQVRQGSPCINPPFVNCVYFISLFEHLEHIQRENIFYAPFLLQFYPPQWASSFFILLIGIDDKRWRNSSPEKQTAVQWCPIKRTCQKHKDPAVNWILDEWRLCFENVKIKKQTATP